MIKNVNMLMAKEFIVFFAVVNIFFTTIFGMSNEFCKYPKKREVEEGLQKQVPVNKILECWRQNVQNEKDYLEKNHLKIPNEKYVTYLSLGDREAILSLFYGIEKEIIRKQELDAISKAYKQFLQEREKAYQDLLSLQDKDITKKYTQEYIEGVWSQEEIDNMQEICFEKKNWINRLFQLPQNYDDFKKILATMFVAKEVEKRNALRKERRNGESNRKLKSMFNMISSGQDLSMRAIYSRCKTQQVLFNQYWACIQDLQCSEKKGVAKALQQSEIHQTFVQHELIALAGKCRKVDSVLSLCQAIIEKHDIQDLKSGNALYDIRSIEDKNLMVKIKNMMYPIEYANKSYSMTQKQREYWNAIVYNQNEKNQFKQAYKLENDNSILYFNISKEKINHLWQKKPKDFKILIEVLSEEYNKAQYYIAENIKELKKKVLGEFFRPGTRDDYQFDKKLEEQSKENLFCSEW